jgi:hypothetical protein
VCSKIQKRIARLIRTLSTGRLRASAIRLKADIKLECLKRAACDPKQPLNNSESLTSARTKMVANNRSRLLWGLAFACLVFVFLNIIVVWLAYLASNSFLSVVRDEFPLLFQVVGTTICPVTMLAIGKFTIGPADKKLRDSRREQ